MRYLHARDPATQLIDLDSLLGEVLATVLLNIDNVVAIKHVSECRRVAEKFKARHDYIKSLLPKEGA